MLMYEVQTNFSLSESQHEEVSDLSLLQVLLTTLSKVPQLYQHELSVFDRLK
jgi:hypothetical protein